MSNNNDFITEQKQETTDLYNQYCNNSDDFSKKIISFEVVPDKVRLEI